MPATSRPVNDRVPDERLALRGIVFQLNFSRVGTLAFVDERGLFSRRHVSRAVATVRRHANNVSFRNSALTSGIRSVRLAFLYT